MGNRETAFCVPGPLTVWGSVADHLQTTFGLVGARRVMAARRPGDQPSRSFTNL
jgi:hypothetical protein